MRCRIGAALLLATGCRGFPCTDDIGFPDDETFISFVPAETWWNEGAYRVEITDVVRDDEQAKDGRKVCAEWSRVSVDVPAP